MTESACNCRTMAQITDDDEGFTYSSQIAYCPVHEAAPAMLRLLENIVKAPREKGSSLRVLLQIQGHAQDVINKAKGGGR